MPCRARSRALHPSVRTRAHSPRLRPYLDTPTRPYAPRPNSNPQPFRATRATPSASPATDNEQRTTDDLQNKPTASPQIPIGDAESPFSCLPAYSFLTKQTHRAEAQVLPLQAAKFPLLQ